ncbi:MAG: metallophosphoesterase [Phyllobacterium sp.]
MMKKMSLILMLGLGLMAQPLAVIETQAASRPQAPDSTGERCTTPARGSGVVVGRYTGITDIPSSVSFYRCFASIAECRSWLYGLRSKYTDGNAVLIGCERR